MTPKGDPFYAAIETAKLVGLLCTRIAPLFSSIKLAVATCYPGPGRFGPILAVLKYDRRRPQRP